MIAAYCTLRHTYDHLHPIIEALRHRGHTARVVSTWKGAEWADNIVTQERALERDDVTWLVASSMDAEALSPRKVIYVERGCGQTYDSDTRSLKSNSYSTGVIRNAVLFLCPNRFVAERRWRNHGNTLAVVVGMPKLDEYHNLRGMHEGVHRQMVGFAFGQIRGDKPTICPETRGAFEFWQPELKHLALRLRHAGFFPVATAHPRCAKRVRYHTERSGFEWMESEDVLRTAGQLWFDNTSLGYEFAALDRPVGLLDAPWYRRDVHHGLRFWECIPGPEAADVNDVVELTRLQLDDPWAKQRSCADLLFERFDGHASERAAWAVEKVALASAS